MIEAYLIEVESIRATLRAMFTQADNKATADQRRDLCNRMDALLHKAIPQ